MRIAFIHPSHPSSEGTGATHSATQIVHGLVTRGHDVDVFCPKEPDPEAVEAGIDLIHLTGHSRHVHTRTRLNREVLARRDLFREYDVIHCYQMTLMPSVGELGKELDVKTFVTLNAYGAICAKNDLLYLDNEQCESRTNAKCLNCIARTGLSNNEQGYLYQTAGQLFSLRSINRGEHVVEYIDGFRAPSDHVRENYAAFGFPRERISVIPHPLNHTFLVDHRSDFTEPIELLYVGFLERHKGVDKLVPIVSQLREQGVDIRLTVAGTGGYQSKIASQAATAGIEDRVDLRGFVPNDELPTLYAQHDLFIHPGIWEEPLARVYIEALATGTPIVTREYGSIQSIIGAGGVTTDGSVDDFVRTIVSLITEDRLPALSKGAKEHVQRYDRDRIVSQVESMYELAR